MQVIQQMTRGGLRPITAICDGAAENMKWIKSVGQMDPNVHFGAYYMVNPMTRAHIIMTVDTVHSMKNWRGSLFSSGTVRACCCNMRP